MHGQSIYTKAELNAAGIIGPANITALGFYVATAPSLALPNFIIRMKHTSATNMSAWQTADGLSTVYTSSSYLPTAGAYDMLTLSTPFIWNGVDNILVDTAFSLLASYTSTGTVRYSTVTSGYRYLQSDTADQSSIFTGGTTSNNRPNIRLSFSQISPLPIPFAEGDLYIAFTNSSDGTLPLTLSAFQASIAYSGGVQLNWISATETGLLGYYLFRSDTELLENAALITELIPGSNTSTEQHYTYQDQEVLPSTQYYYWLQGVDLDGWVAYYGPISIVTDDSNGPGTPEIPILTALIDNVPNPFNPETSIRYSVEAAAEVELSIYNSRGQFVRSYKASHNRAGYYSWFFDGRDAGGRELSSGVYYCRMTSSGQSYLRRLLLPK